MLASVVAFGAIYLSPPLIQTVLPGGITIVLLDRAGRFQARIEGVPSVLRRAQYRASETPDDIVRGFVLGKIANQRAVLMRGFRDHGDELAPERRSALTESVDRLDRILRRANLATEGVDALRGDESEAANVYFNLTT
jgi:CRISPR-associated protein Cas1